MDVAAGELDNEHQEGGCNPLSVVIPGTCCQSQSACTMSMTKTVRGNIQF